MTNRLLGAAAGLAFSSATLASSPISLTYKVTPLADGRFHYRFTLELTNQDHSWAHGQSFGWLVFGDGAGQPSPLADFEGDISSLVWGPWARFHETAGYNNGPSLGRVRDMWRPYAVGESISWEGTSRADQRGGELRWSFLITEGRAGPIELESARLVTDCGPADVNHDGYLDGVDFELFTLMYNASDPDADLDHDGFVTPNDWEAYLNAFAAGC